MNQKQIKDMMPVFVEGVENLIKLNNKAMRKKYNRTIEMEKFVEGVLEPTKYTDKKTGETNYTDINFPVILAMRVEQPSGRAGDPHILVRCNLRYGIEPEDTIFLDMSLSDYKSLPKIEA